jgi:pilus assembly protein FimV
MQSRIDELEAEVSDSRRLIELRDQELRDLQEQLANIEEQAAPTDLTDIAPIEPEPGIEPLPAEEMTAEDTTDLEAEAPADATEAADVELAEPEPVTPGPGTVVTTSPPEESSFIAQLFSSIWLYISLAIVLLLGWLVARRRTADEGQGDSWGRLEPDVDEPAAMATAAFGGAAVTEDPSFVVEEQAGREEEAYPEDDSPFADTQARPEHEFAADAEEPELPLERTISAESAVNLDQADPVAEADFHMAYGLYDQAADLLTEALEAEPERKELRLKLLEVYFIWENQGGFLKEAQNLHQNIDADSDPDWNKVLIMGKQICPAEELFAAAPSAPGEEGEIDLAFGEEAELGEDAEIDITFGAADENVDLLFGEDDADDMIDFDLTGQELWGLGVSPT